MKKPILIVLISVGIIIVLTIVLSFVFNYGQKLGEKTGRALILNLLESKVTRGLSVGVSGEITEISDRTLTLSAEEDTLTVLIRDDAPIHRLIRSEEYQPGQPVTREEIEFEAIKIGDWIGISCELKADGTLEGIGITIF